MKQEIALKIGGSSGQGLKTAGYILTKTLKDLGWWTFSQSEYPSLIKGGHSSFQINVSSKKIYSSTLAVDILIALNEETVDIHEQLIKRNGYLLYNATFNLSSKLKRDLKKRKISAIGLPAGSIVVKNNGMPVMTNTVFLSAGWALLCNNFTVLEEQITKIFKKKSKDFETNLTCAKEGFEFIKNKRYVGFSLPLKKTKKRIIGTGNEVAGLSTYAAGCRLYVAYPMTPSTGILDYLAARCEKYGMIIKQAEDEMTAVFTAIGANYAGTRAACGTSGGGFALMSESISLAGMSETPLVVFEGQRPGPATGLPTWTEQGDLNFVLNAGHGDFPRIILAPGDIDELYELVPKAFDLAEKYHTPVILLTDKYLGESWYQTEKFNPKKIQVKRQSILSQSQLSQTLKYKRYKFTVSGISPRALPGHKNGIFLANSDEHDEYGYSSEDAQNRKLMMEKRMRKLQVIANEFPEPKLYGPKDARTTLITWGSTKGPALDTLDELNKNSSNVNVLHYSFMYPLKTKRITELAKRNTLITVENNFSGQFANLLHTQTRVNIHSQVTKYTGSQFFNDELLSSIKKKL